MFKVMLYNLARKEVDNMSEELINQILDDIGLEKIESDH